jgi:ABC-type transporter Mla maintaining outer membrane lipid asymmetry ATPase subunit MlaF
MILFVMRMRRPIYGRSQGNDQTDSDDLKVNQERDRVAGIVGQKTGEKIIVSGLTKSFGQVEAVKGISFGVNTNESFILLGINGAGKTTTFKCLAAQERATSGTLIIDGVDIREIY